MLALLLALFLSTAHAECPVTADNPIRADGTTVSVGKTVYVLSNAGDRSRLAGILSACNVGRAPDHLQEFADARRKVVIRGISGLIFWPIWIFVIPPAMKMSESRASLVASINT